ncbi:type 1 glutamine amidotransferase [Ensifer sp. LC163]|uniref:type 1 glutamine amidotransferase n=1 Tax=Ensifer sp. LC163 TaxID=1120652 RepID=UPI000812CF03|nr:type 1 glutamine amidotransferase [Ensifer sp. LC163]OCP34580.1 GMP synthase [Ensifer sp. LC163]
MRVLVVENMAKTELGQVGTALREVKAEIEVRRAYAGDPVPDAPDGFDALVVLGGEQSALDDETFPYLPQLTALMRRFGDSERSVLGICLGSQLLARAYGAKNLLGEAKEFGWHDVRVRAEGQSDPVLASVGESFPIFQWHGDTFTLPQGAVHLAENDVTRHQAFRIGRAAYGTQFHFEADTDLVEDWNRSFPQTINRLDPNWLAQYPAHARRHGEKANAAGLALARAWVATIRRGDALAAVPSDEVLEEAC